MEVDRHTTLLKDAEHALKRSGSTRGKTTASWNKMEVDRETRLLKADEVVVMTGWSRAKVYAMAVSGEIPSLRTGRSVRIPLAALERWIEKNTTGGNVN